MAYGRETGKEIDYLTNIRQQIAEILETPKQTRLIAREYGCDLYTLVDKSITPELKREVVRIAYEALVEQLPAVKVRNISVGQKIGQLEIYLDLEIDNQLIKQTVRLGD